MKHLRGAVIATTLLVSGSMASGPEVVNPRQVQDVAELSSAAEKQALADSFERLRAYWLGKNIGMAATRLIVLDQANPKRTCPGTNGNDPLVLDAADEGADIYCFTSNEVVLSMAFLRALARTSKHNRLNEPLARDFIIAHEEGHAVQIATGKNQLLRDYGRMQEFELQADCYAGRALAAIEPAAIEAAAQFLATLIWPDPEHGTPEQRIASLHRGADGEPC